jgi:Plavaka transposase
MTGNWAWKQAVSCFNNDVICTFFNAHFQDIIADDPQTHGRVFVPVILGSDKTMVSVATGQNEYYPLYGLCKGWRSFTRTPHPSQDQ